MGSGVTVTNQSRNKRKSELTPKLTKRRREYFIHVNSQRIPSNTLMIFCKNVEEGEYTYHKMVFNNGLITAGAVVKVKGIKGHKVVNCPVMIINPTDQEVCL